MLASPTVDQVTGTTYIGCLGGTMGAFDAWGKNLWFAPGGSGPIYSSACGNFGIVFIYLHVLRPCPMSRAFLAAMPPHTRRVTDSAYWTLLGVHSNHP